MWSPLRSVPKLGYTISQYISEDLRCDAFPERVSSPTPLHTEIGRHITYEMNQIIDNVSSRE